MQTVRMIGRATCINFAGKKKKKKSNNKKTTKIRKHGTDERKKLWRSRNIRGVNLREKKKKQKN